MSDNNLAYIPLHVHSCYSINDGLQNVGDIVKAAKKLKLPAIAVTDFNNMAGFVRFYNACLGSGIKPLMGADLQVKENSKPGDPDRYFNVTLLAMDRVGKQNLYDILSDAWINTASPDIATVAAKVDDLWKYSEGIILLNGFRGDIAQFVKEDNINRAEERLKEYQKFYGDRFCFEITRTGREFETEFENFALNCCLKYGISPVATNDTRFLQGPDNVPADGFSDYYVHDIRVSIQQAVQKGNKENARRYSPEQYLRSPEEMKELFADLPEALENTRVIAERCNVEIELDYPRLPRYDTGDLSTADCLRLKAKEGLEARLKFLYPDEAEREAKRPVYEERLNTELDVIINMDFPGYFLIVMEFIQWSKAHGVPVGPGRGSGGGSLVAYALTITDFDPLRFDLLFERFLNPERVSMPDFDVDFCQRKRYKTLQHVVDHYGRNAVSQIAAFGTLAPKAAIQGVGRAIGVPLGQVRRIASLIPETPGTSFRDCLGIGKKGEKVESVSPDFLNFYNQAKINDDKESVELIDVSIRLEGVIRSIGKHAAGVVISPTRIAEFAPLMLDSDGNPITQYDKKDVEHAGLVKFDFLGLTTLTIIDDAKEMIDAKLARIGKDNIDISKGPFELDENGIPHINIAAIPYEDEDSYKMIQETETTAVFQLESTGMRKLIGKMQPDRFDDLVALVALYRPGPLNSGMVDHFVNRKHGSEPVSYPLPDAQDLDLKPILDSTYGVIVYQEQVMQIAQVLAGYSLGGADILRRAMGKKIPAEMAAQREVFNKGALKKGKDLKIMEQIFDQVEMFAAYGFNKSHSAAYALVAWWTLYLKVHYPAEFLAAMMTADCMKTEKLIAYIGECHRLGVNVNPPDVNIGKFHFGVDINGNVVYGFSAIKGVGEKLVDHIVEDREKNGIYTDFFDFVYRVGPEFLSKGTLEALVKSGALDSIGPNRAKMLASIPTALKYATQKTTNLSTGQIDLLSMLDDSNVKPAYAEVRDWSDKVRLHHEKQLLGLYLSGHPIGAYRTELIQYCGDTNLNNMIPGTPDRPNLVTVGAVVTNPQMKISSRDNAKFYTMTLDDGYGNFEIMLFHKNAEKFAGIEKRMFDLKKKKKQVGNDDIQAPLILVVTGYLSLTNEGVLRLRVKDFHTLESLRVLKAKKITLNFTMKTLEENIKAIDETLLRNRISKADVKNMLRDSDDPDSVIKGCSLNMIIDNQLITLRQDTYAFIPSDDLVEGIRDIAGSQSVHISYV
ncbi:MAG: DNA polymerase III subunit alpha [Succinivibrio sp.]